MNEMINAQRDQELLHNPLAAIVECSEDAIISKTLDGIVQSWNPSAEKMFDYPAKQMIGKSVFCLIPESKYQQERQLLHRLSEGQLISHFETQRIARDGRLVDISLTLSPIRNPAGEIMGASSIARDITAKKRFEKELVHTKEKLAMALTLTGLGIWEYDITNRQLLTTQETWAICGIDMDPKPCLDGFLAAVHPDDRPIIHKLTDAHCICQDSQDFSEEIRLIHEGDSTVKWARLQGKYLQNHLGRPDKILGTLMDITAEKNQTRMLEMLVAERTAELGQTNRKLADSNQQLERFAFTASHDLREPLRKLVSLGDLLRASLPQDPAKAMDIMCRIESSAVRMMALIENLLEFSRVSQSADSPFEPVDLGKAIREALDDLDALIVSTGATIAIVGDLDVTIYGNHLLLKQVFQNLLQNAVKFSRPGVPAHIQISPAISGGDDQAPEPRFIHLAIKDNGIGFDPSHATRIFGLFERLNGRSEYEGTGMGLAIVKKIVETHRGTVHACGEPGEGTVFTVTLPLASG